VICIINIGEFHETDINEYELRINYKVIGTFKHKRSDGLAECLRRAAKCAEISMLETNEEDIINENDDDNIYADLPPRT